MKTFSYYKEGFFKQNSEKSEMNRRMFYLILGLFFLFLWIVIVYPSNAFPSDLLEISSVKLGPLLLALVSPWIAAKFMFLGMEENLLWWQKKLPIFGYFLSSMFFGFVVYYTPIFRDIFINALLITLVFTTIGAVYPKLYESWRSTVIVSVLGFVVSAAIFFTEPDIFFEFFVFRWVVVFILAFLIGGVFYQAHRIPRNLNNAMLATGFFFVWH